MAIAKLGTLFSVKDIEPAERGAFTFLTVYRVFFGEGSETIYKACASISRPSIIAIDSKSPSFSPAS